MTNNKKSNEVKSNEATDDGLQVWIGLARVRQVQARGILGDADGAYANVIALAKNRKDFRSKVKAGLDNLEMALLRLEGAEVFEERISKYEVTRDLCQLADEVKQTGELAFGTFHAF